VTKVSKIKYEKYGTLCRMLRSIDPAQCGLKRTRIEPATLDFRPGAKRVMPARRADQLDRSDLPFWERVASMLVHGLTLFPSQLGTTQVSWGLALICTNHCIIYLEFETTLRWFGEGLVTLTPGWWGDKTPHHSSYR
jgi:hypothetical protein